MSATGSVQSSFTGPMERSREVVERLLTTFDKINYFTIAVSGGTDSVVAADVFCRLLREYGVEPDSVTHINTGLRVPQSALTARIIADVHGLEFIEQGYRNPQDSIAERILEHGWPGGYAGSPVAGGHGLEWANRKDKPMNAVYVDIDGFQVWGSGARKLESKKRNANLPDSGIETDKPRRAWCAVIGGWTEHEKREYIKERGLPVSEAYLLLGFSGECVGCSFDDKGLLTGIDLLCPELAHAIRTLSVWLYMRTRRGDIDIGPKQLCWGWSPGDEVDDADDTDTAQYMVGCDMETCAEREAPQWTLDLPAPQIVTRSDVVEYWRTGDLPGRFPI